MKILMTFASSMTCDHINPSRSRRTILKDTVKNFGLASQVFEHKTYLPHGPWKVMSVKFEDRKALC